MASYAEKLAAQTNYDQEQQRRRKAEAAAAAARNAQPYAPQPSSCGGCQHPSPSSSAQMMGGQGESASGYDPGYEAGASCGFEHQTLTFPDLAVDASAGDGNLKSFTTGEVPLVDTDGISGRVMGKKIRRLSVYAAASGADVSAFDLELLLRSSKMIVRQSNNVLHRIDLKHAQVENDRLGIRATINPVPWSFGATTFEIVGQTMTDGAADYDLIFIAKLEWLP